MKLWYTFIFHLISKNPLSQSKGLGIAQLELIVIIIFVHDESKGTSVELRVITFSKRIA